MADHPTSPGEAPSPDAMGEGTRPTPPRPPPPPPPPSPERPGDEPPSRGPSKAVWALGLAILIAVVVGIIGVASREGNDALQDGGRDPTTSARATDRATTTDAPETTTTTLDLAALAAERQAGAEAACAEAVNAPLGAEATGFGSYADRAWDPDWSAVGPRADFDRQVVDCAAPQRAVRYETECGTPNVGLVQRDPDSHAGECVTMHALVSQFDQATGLCGFRAWWDDDQHTYNFDYEGENAIVTTTEPCPALDAVGVDDVVRLRAVILGGVDYETTTGGTAHGVQFWAYSAEVVAGT